MDGSRGWLGGVDEMVGSGGCRIYSGSRGGWVGV